MGLACALTAHEGLVTRVAMPRRSINYRELLFAEESADGRGERFDVDEEGVVAFE